MNKNTKLETLRSFIQGPTPRMDGMGAGPGPATYKGPGTTPAAQAAFNQGSNMAMAGDMNMQRPKAQRPVAKAKRPATKGKPARKKK